MLDQIFHINALMHSFGIEVVVSTFLSAFVLILNAFFELVRVLTKRKADIDPKKQVVVITGNSK